MRFSFFAGFSLLVHSAMDTAWNNTEPYLKKLIPPTLENSEEKEKMSEENEQSKSDSNRSKDSGSGGVLSNIIGILYKNDKNTKK